jgi:hypothetical protein
LALSSQPVVELCVSKPPRRAYDMGIRVTSKLSP